MAISLVVDKALLTKVLGKGGIKQMPKSASTKAFSADIFFTFCKILLLQSRTSLL